MQTVKKFNGKQEAAVEIAATIPRVQPSLFADLPVTAEKPGVPQRRQARVLGKRGDHLAAAQGLAKALRKSPNGRKAQQGRRRKRQQTGIAICQHLIALLQESEQVQEPSAT